MGKQRSIGYWVASIPERNRWLFKLDGKESSFPCRNQSNFLAEELVLLLKKFFELQYVLALSQEKSFSPNTNVVPVHGQNEDA